MSCSPPLRGSSKLYIVALAVLLPVGTARGDVRELLFPIVTHIGNHESRLFMLNPSAKYRVRGRMQQHSPGRGSSSHYITVVPNSLASSLPNWDFAGRGEWKRGWASFRYRFLDVPAADKERVEDLRLQAWTELILKKRRGWLGSTNSAIAVASIPAVEAALEFQVPGILRRAPEVEAAIAILNPSEDPIQIEMTLFYYNPQEHTEEDIQITNNLSVPPMDRLSRFLWDLMAEGQDDPPERPMLSYRSTLRIRGNAPIAVGALLYYRSSGVFGNLPVVRVAQK